MEGYRHILCAIDFPVTVNKPPNELLNWRDITLHD